MQRRRSKLLLAVALILVLCAAVSPWVVRGYWLMRSSNPVRRGVARAQELGCFSCHGTLGDGGVADPRAGDGEVPAWSGGVWMMYVRDDGEIRETILDGVSRRRLESVSATRERESRAIGMPAYRDLLRGSDLDDLVAAFKVLSGMTRPAAQTAERRGYDLARKWSCFSCHGPGASGGLANPGSFTGFIPGWYGADFADLVRDREEFDAWILEGTIPRLRRSRLATFFLRRQRIAMPAYADLAPGDLDDLWAYTRWLEANDGGHRAPARKF